MPDATEHSEVIIHFVFKINAVRNQAQGQLQIAAHPVANWTLRVHSADVIQYFMPFICTASSEGRLPLHPRTVERERNDHRTRVLLLHLPVRVMHLWKQAN